MSLSLGIAGLPNVGKSTLFAALTRNEVEIANYPFATIDPNVGIVEVPDERLQKLAELSQSKKIVPTIIEFADIAGLVKGAHEGEGLGNQFLSHIREVDAIVYVVRAFEAGDIQHVEESIDPIRDSETVRSELALKDLETIEKRIASAGKEARGGDKDAQKEVEILEKWQSVLNEGTHIYEYIRDNGLFGDQATMRVRRTLQLLTAKPAIYLVNTHDGFVGEELKAYIEGLGYAYVAIDARAELESAGMSASEREELGLGESALPALIRIAYETLGLITFFTTGPDETRAWTIQTGATAPNAAGAIHTDFEQKFIRAEVVQWDVLLNAGGWGEARGNGFIRTEGKEYIIQDGDVVVILHSA